MVLPVNRKPEQRLRKKEFHRPCRLVKDAFPLKGEVSNHIGEEITEKQFAFQMAYSQASSSLIQKRIPFGLVSFKQLHRNFYYFKICYTGLSL